MDKSLDPPVLAFKTVIGKAIGPGPKQTSARTWQKLEMTLPNNVKERKKDDQEGRAKNDDNTRPMDQDHAPIVKNGDAAA